VYSETKRARAIPAQAELAGEHARSWPRTRAVSSLVSAVGLGFVALLPRGLGLADFLTTDEAFHWIGRVERFAGAIERREWAATWQTGHPGVTQMWLGTLGLWLERLALEQGWTMLPSRVEHLAWLRLPSAVVQALAVALGYLLLRRLVKPRAALLAALLWATSPFLIAHGRLLHLDAPLTAFVTLAVLAMLVACRSDRRAGWIVAAGMAGGLALLTKGPALIILPVAGLLLFGLLTDGDFAGRLGLSLRWYALWLGVALVVVAALWPALWVAPGHALANYLEEIVANGGRPNGDGQFFLGRAVDDPGPLFYPVAALYRLTPVALLGLCALPLALRRQHTDRRMLLALGGFVLFWFAVMMLGSKKFDRYVLPAWPALLALAAAGLSALYQTVSWRLPAWLAAPGRLLAALSLCAALLQPLLAYHPHYLSYYSPLLGGGAAAQRSLLIGWGEGMEHVGAYLRARPDVESGPILSALPATLQPFVPAPVKFVEEYGKGPANYAVVYLESLQRGDNPAVYEQIRETVPLREVVIHGIRYATIHQLAKPFNLPIGARFGAALHLRGVTIEQQAESLTVTPSWDVRAAAAGDYMVFLHLLDGNGQRVAQIDVPPGGDLPPTSAWLPGEQIAVPLPLPLPAVLPDGDYRLVMGLYDAVTGERLPVTGGTAVDPAVAGAHALMVGRVTIDSE
jgi:hypothetical protein